MDLPAPLIARALWFLNEMDAPVILHAAPFICRTWREACAIVPATIKLSGADTADGNIARVIRFFPKATICISLTPNVSDEDYQRLMARLDRGTKALRDTFLSRPPCFRIARHLVSWMFDNMCPANGGTNHGEVMQGWLCMEEYARRLSVDDKKAHARIIRSSLLTYGEKELTTIRVFVKSRRAFIEEHMQHYDCSSCTGLCTEAGQEREGIRIIFLPGKRPFGDTNE